MTRGTLLFALAACGAPSAAPQAPAPAASAPAAAAPAKHQWHDPDDTLVGVIDQPAPPWQVAQWFNSPPLSLESLRGKVVFVRWFTDPSCPFCSGTAPTLRALHEHYADKGLAVIGMYHHKEDTPLDPVQVEGWVKHYGYQFPVAIDKDWTTLKRWWLRDHDRSYTSVSFLIDKAGVVRRVHLGGLIAPEGEDITAIRADVERLLAE
ncbi:MAG TPA: redoxin domain-containing protein [Kofleriaceae bacterium]|jgi:peroxiredoxin|nr:redoxin domain-containing protein [Kofleriaceae bacterium]